MTTSNTRTTSEDLSKPVDGAALEMTIKPRTESELLTDAAESLKDAAHAIEELQADPKAGVEAA